VKLLALSSDDVAEIKTLCETHQQRDVAKLFRCHPSTISKARRGLSWRADGPADPYRPNAKLTLDAVREIRSSDLSFDTLARKYGVRRRTISRAATFQTWRTA
jgi:hypothetical protein